MSTQMSKSTRIRRLLLLPTGKHRGSKRPPMHHVEDTDIPVAEFFTTAEDPVIVYPPKPERPPAQPAALKTNRVRRIVDKFWDTGENIVIAPLDTTVHPTINPVDGTVVDAALTETAFSVDESEKLNDLLVSDGWDKMFRDGPSDKVMSIPVILLDSGSTAEIPKITTERIYTTHLCRKCHTLTDGRQLHGKSWQCGTCKEVGSY